MMLKYVCVGLLVGSFVLYVSADTVPILGDDDEGGIEIIGPTISPENPPISQDSGIMMVTGEPDESVFKYHSAMKKGSAKPKMTTQKELTQTLPTIEVDEPSTNQHTDGSLIEIYPDGHTEVIKNHHSGKTTTSKYKKRPPKPAQEERKPKQNYQNVAPTFDQYDSVNPSQYQPKRPNNPKQYEPVTPNPKQYELVNPSHKQYELVNPNPKRYEIVNPNADRYEVVKPDFNRYQVVKPNFDEYEVVSPNFNKYEPVNPSPYRPGYGNVLDKVLRPAFVPYPGLDSNYEVVNPNYPNVNVQHPHYASHPPAQKKAQGLDALNAKVLDVLNLNVG